MRIRNLCIAFLGAVIPVLICTSAFAQTVDWSPSPSTNSGASSQNYIVSIPGTNQKAHFQFIGSQEYTLLNVLRGSAEAKANIQTWDLFTTANNNLTDPAQVEQAISNLWWIACRDSSISAYLPPHSPIDNSEIASLKRAPAGLPTQWVTGAFKHENYWWRESLQRILARSTPVIQPGQDANEKLKFELQRLATGRNVAGKIAEAYEDAAKSGDMPFDFAMGRASLFRSAKSVMQITKGQEGEIVIPSKDGNVSLPIDKAVVVLQFISALQDKMTLDKERADRLVSVIDWAERNHINLNSDFKKESRALAAHVGDFQASARDALVETVIDWGRNNLSGTLSDVGGKVADISVKKLGEAIAEKATEKGAATIGGATEFASGVLGAYALGSLIGDFAFNTNGIYDGVKKTEFCSRAASELSKIVDAASSNAAEASTDDTLAFANAIYLRELAVSSYDDTYARTTDGARLSKLFGGWIAGAVGRETPTESVARHKLLSEREGKDAEDWIHPLLPLWLMAMYKANPDLKLASQPVLIATTSQSGVVPRGAFVSGQGWIHGKDAFSYFEQGRVFSALRENGELIGSTFRTGVLHPGDGEEPTTVEASPPPTKSNAMQLALSSYKKTSSRSVQIVTPSANDVKAVTAFLQTKGLKITSPKLQPTWVADLDGNGKMERIVSAEGGLEKAGGLANWYSVALLISDSGKTASLGSRVVIRGAESDQQHYKPIAIADLDGDNTPEIAVKIEFYEGNGLSLFNWKGGKANTLFSDAENRDEVVKSAIPPKAVTPPKHITQQHAPVIVPRRLTATEAQMKFNVLLETRNFSSSNPLTQQEMFMAVYYAAEWTFQGVLPPMIQHGKGVLNPPKCDDYMTQFAGSELTEWLIGKPLTYWSGQNISEGRTETIREGLLCWINNTHNTMYEPAKTKVRSIVQKSNGVCSVSFDVLQRRGNLTNSPPLLKTGSGSATLIWHGNKWIVTEWRKSVR